VLFASRLAVVIVEAYMEENTAGELSGVCSSMSWYAYGAAVLAPGWVST
jgi:hypothetical protein